MENKNEHPEFELDDILSEFLDLPDAPSGDAPEDSDEVASSAGSLADLEALLGDIAGDSSDDAATTMDTMQMNDLIAQLTQDYPAGDEEQTSEEALPQADADVSQDPTVRLDTLPQQFRRAAEPEDSIQDTIRLTPEAAAASLPESAPKAAPAIIYNPRTRLKELKKKLVAGPEKRYYALSELGVGSLQITMALNLALVALSALVAGMYMLDMLPENRLRFVIFSQVLTLLLSALLGSQQMVEGVADLFKGKLTLNLLLPFTFAVCCVDAVFCLSELRIPCCAAFSLQTTMAIWAQYHQRTTEMAQMDTMRKAVRLHSLVLQPNFYEGKTGLLRGQGEVEDFMDNVDRVSIPQRLQGIYGLVSTLICIGIGIFAGLLHGTSMGIQVLAVSLMAAVPASFFIALTRPAAILENRLHMVGTVFCGWQGVRQLRKKAAFPLRDEDLFPTGSIKLNGVKFYGDRNPDDTVCYCASLVSAAGGSLVGVFRRLLESRDGREYPVKNFRDYGNGSIGGEVCNEPVLLGTLSFLQDMGVEIPAGTMVNQAVYAAIDGQLCAVYAFNYAKMRSATAGLISLCSTRRLTPVLIARDFTVTEGLLRGKFNVRTRRIAFPDREAREALAQIQPDPDAPALALATRDDLVSFAYAATGARALYTATTLGLAIHVLGGVLGMLMMAALAYLGASELLTPVHVLLYQLVWLVPGLLISEWTRTV